MAGIIASLPASLAVALVFYVRDAIYGGDNTLRLLGVFWQFEIGAAWGTIFGITVAFTAHHLPPLAGMFWGAVYGLGIWLVWFVLILPLMRPALAGHTRLGLLAHVVFGAVLGGTFHFVRVRSERRRHRSRAAPPTSGSREGTAAPPR
jgi:hypothetical protein